MISDNLKPCRLDVIDDERIFIFDDIFSLRIVQRVFQVIALSRFTFLHSRRDWTVDFDIETFKKHILYRAAESIVKSYIGDDMEYKCYKIFCNVSGYGQHSLIHNDSDNKDAISVLYYVNQHWENEWEGETIFYDRQNDAKTAISVKPGRFIVFKSNLNHRAGLSSISATELRMTLTFRFMPIIY